MANRIKISPGIDSNSLKVGNFSVGIQGTGMGPTSSTGFYNGEHIPEGGYVIYTDGPTVRVVNNDQELIDTLNKMGSSLPSDDLAGSLQWAKDNGILVIDRHFNNLVTDGLVLNLDAKHIPSYFSNIPATNMLSAGDPDLNHMVIWTNSGQWTWTDNAADIEPPFLNGADGVKIMRGQSNTTGSQHFGCASFAGIGGQTYTMSVWYRQNRAGVSSPYFRTNINNNSLGNLSYNGDTNSANWPVNEWIRISATATLQANEGGAYLSNYLGRQKGDIAWYYAPMVELGSTMSPFVNGTRTQNTEWVDLSGNNHSVNLYNNPVHSGNSLSFDGVDDYARGNSASLTGENFDSTGFTLEGFIKLLNEPGAWRSTFNIENRSNNNHIDIRNSNGYGRMTINYYPGYTDVNAGYVDINENEWYHLAGVWDGSQLMMYVNGKQAGSVASLNSLDLGDSPNFQIGRAYSDNRYVNDEFQAIRVYRRGLTPEEVAQNFYGGNIVTSGLTFATDAGNLVSYEPGSNSIYSLTDSSLEGTLLNGTGWNSANGGYWEFDDSDDKITIPNNAAFNHTSQLTIEAWARFDGNSNDFIFEKGNVNTQYSLFSHGTDIVFRTYHAGDGGYDTQSPSKTSVGIVNGQWHHIVGSWDGSTKRIYIDGVEKNSKSKSGALTTTSQGAAIGAFGGTSSGYYFGGDIAVVRIYNKGLSTSEVLQNFNAQKARFK